MSVRRRKGRDAPEDAGAAEPPPPTEPTTDTGPVDTPSSPPPPPPAPPPLSALDSLLLDTCLSLSVFAVGWVLRLTRIGHPDGVVFDEMHFGKFAALYQQRRFFFDVHPPLGKMIIAAAGYLGGLTSKFQFTRIGQGYEDGDAYEAMRMASAALGALHVPLMYLVGRQLGLTRMSCVLAGFLVAVDNAMIAQSRSIFLDSSLVFFLLLTVGAHLRFVNCRRPFGVLWWWYLAWTGVFLGATLSVKFVGLFAVALVGGCTCVQLWGLIGDHAIPARRLLDHFLARVAGLILLPVGVYVAIFSLHLAIVNHSGPGDSFMSQSFQATLHHNLYASDRYTPPAAVYLGSRVVLTSVETPACHLYSHNHRYPYYPSGDTAGFVSSHQQQVVCRSGSPSVLSEWFIAHPEWPFNETVVPPKQKARKLQHGQTVRLIHIATRAALQSHDIAGPLTPTAQEVSGYQDGDERAPRGQPGHQARQDLWIIEAKDPADPGIKEKGYQFRLRHKESKMLLRTTLKELPAWGLNHMEIVAARDLSPPAGLWRVSNQSSPLIPGRQLLQPDLAIEKSGFWARFAELHYRMISANNDLKSQHVYATRPSSWLLMQRGTSYYQSPEGSQIFLLGNPAVWWWAAATIVATALLELFYAARRKRQVKDVSDEHYFLFVYQARFCVAGWLLHYAPFFLMKRQLFLHHYLPALVFTVLLVAVYLEHACRRLLASLRLHAVAVASGMCAAAICCYHFAPITYGLPLERQEIDARRWLGSWQFQVEFTNHGART